MPLARVADELWYWLLFRDQTPAPVNDRLHRLVIEVACEARPDPISDDLAPLLTDPEALTAYRATGLVVPSRLPEALTRRVEGAAFCGPQLGQLVLAVERGLHAMLVGPRGRASPCAPPRPHATATASCGLSKATRRCSRWTCWAAMCRTGRLRRTHSRCKQRSPAAWRRAAT